MPFSLNASTIHLQIDSVYPFIIIEVIGPVRTLEFSDWKPIFRTSNLNSNLSFGVLNLNALFARLDAPEAFQFKSP